MVRTIEDMVKRFCHEVPCEDCPMYDGYNGYSKDDKMNGKVDLCTKKLTDWFIDEAYMRRAE